MLQQPARPSGNVQLPYTTADMAERLAKRKAAKDRQDIIDSLSGGLSYGKSGVDITPQLSQVGGMVKGLINMPAATVMDVVSGIVRPLDKYVGGVKDPVDQFRPEDYGTSNLISGTAQGLEQAGRRAVGDITAIPYVGKPSASPTATDIKRLGVIEGLSKAGIDYGNLALTAAPFVKPSAFGISNAYQDMLEARLAYKNRSPFPTVKTPGSVIDVDALQGSRLPARIVDTPPTPATRLAEAQTQRALPPAEIAPEITNVRSLNAFRTKTNRNDPRWQTKDQYGFLQDESFKPITTASDQVEYDAVFLTYRPPGMKELLDELNFKPYNKEGALSYNYEGVIPLFNDQLFLKINNGHHNGMGNFIDVYEQPPLWDFVNEDQLKYLGQAYGPETTRQLQRIFATAAPEAPTTPATRLAEAQTQRAVPPAEIAPTEVAPTTSRLTPPALRERQVPSTSRLTLQLQGEKFPDGTPMLHKNQYITIRSFDQTTGEYTGVITIGYNAQTKKAVVDGMGATNPMVTPQLIAAAASEVRKIVGNVQYPLTPSASLSAYSRPFVERLQQAGLIDPDYELPEINMMNPLDKMAGPESFAPPTAASGLSEVINPLSYQPTYNQILQSLVESRRQAKLAGETGRLNTSSTQLKKLKNRPQGLNDAAAYRINMRHRGHPEHPLLKQMSDNEFDSFMGEIYQTPGSAARKLIDMWEKIKPSDERGYWGAIYANTPKNLKKFPDLLKDAYLINEATRIRLMSELETRLLIPGDY